MFLHVSVILFTGGVCPIACWTTLPGPEAGTPTRADTPPGPGTLPTSAVHAGRYGQQAGGTHPTGMQSCGFFYIYRYTSTVKVTKLFTACGMLHFPRPLKSIKRKSISKIFSVFHINAKKKSS